MRLRRTRVTSFLLAKMIKCLESGTLTQLEIIEHTGLAESTVYGFLSSFYEFGLIHICEWEEDSLGRRQVKIYKWGAGKDAPRPAPLSNTELSRRKRAKERAAKLLHRMAGKVEHAEVC